MTREQKVYVFELIKEAENNINFTMIMEREIGNRGMLVLSRLRSELANELKPGD